METTDRNQACPRALGPPARPENELEPRRLQRVTSVIGADIFHSSSAALPGRDENRGEVLFVYSDRSTGHGNPGGSSASSPGSPESQGAQGRSEAARTGRARETESATTSYLRESGAQDRSAQGREAARQSS